MSLFSDEAVCSWGQGLSLAVSEQYLMVGCLSQLGPLAATVIPLIKQHPQCPPEIGGLEFAVNLWGQFDLAVNRGSAPAKHGACTMGPTESRVEKDPA